MEDSWTATYTPTSSLSGRLNVEGKCTSVGGETFTLKRHQGHGTNSGTLVLDKTATPPRGSIHNDLVIAVALTYEEQVDAASYSYVEILPERIKIAVERLSMAASSST